MSYHFQIKESISDKSFLVTGGAGFIGSNIVEYLIHHKAKRVVVLDNLSTGYKANIQQVIDSPGFEFIEGDITNPDDCQRACTGIDYVLHHAALGSVPRSINDPAATNMVNVTGFLNMLIASKDNHVKRFIFASSSSVYGNDKTMPKTELKTGDLLSPYAVSKKTNELYAEVFAKTYGLEIIGLRYFNVFGPKQNIAGPYAAVIPLFITSLLEHKAPSIFGDGMTTRDFTFVENVIQANMLAALTENPSAVNQIYNIAYGGTVSLNTLFNEIASKIPSDIKPAYKDERKGDIKDSFADISKAKNLLGFSPKVDVAAGLEVTIKWYKQQNA